MSRRVQFVAAFAVLLSISAYLQTHAAEGEEEKAIAAIENAVKELNSDRKLTIKKCAKATSAKTYAKILDLSPCSPPPVKNGNVTIEMTTEMVAGQSEPNSVLFIQYLFCVDDSNGKLILKQSDSILLDPGIGVCGLPAAQLNNLHSGSYTIFGRVSTRNPDDSETIRANKQCRFVVP